MVVVKYVYIIQKEREIENYQKTKRVKEEEKNIQFFCNFRDFVRREREQPSDFGENSN